MNTRTRNHLLWSLLLFSAAVRMFFYFQLRDTDLAAVPLLDSETYHDWAARLAADGVFGMIYAGLGLNEQVLQEGERAPDAFLANQDRWIRSTACATLPTSRLVLATLSRRSYSAFRRCSTCCVRIPTFRLWRGRVREQSTLNNFNNILTICVNAPLIT